MGNFVIDIEAITNLFHGKSVETGDTTLWIDEDAKNMLCLKKPELKIKTIPIQSVPIEATEYEPCECEHEPLYRRPLLILAPTREMVQSPIHICKYCHVLYADINVDNEQDE